MITGDFTYYINQNYFSDQFMDDNCDENETFTIDCKKCECIKKRTGFKCIPLDAKSCATKTTEESQLYKLSEPIPEPIDDTSEGGVTIDDDKTTEAVTDPSEVRRRKIDIVRSKAYSVCSSSTPAPVADSEKSKSINFNNNCFTKRFILKIPENTP